MKTRVQALIGLAFASALAIATPVAAQAVPPDPGGAIVGADRAADAVARLRAFADRQGADDGAIDGEAGLYVLTEQDIFFAFAGFEAAHSSNPLRNADDVGGSAYGELSLGGGMQTTLADRWNVSASLSLTRTDYAEDFAPSGASATATASVGTPIRDWPVQATLAAFVGWTMDADFADPTRFQGLTAQVAGRWMLGERLELAPALFVTRITSETEENDATAIGARASLTREIGPVIATLSAAVTRTLFDDFYEDVTFVERGDWQTDAALTVEWPLSERLSVTASLQYVSRESDFFLASHDGFDGGVSLSARWRF
jgi:hypothetical protein